MRSCFLHLDEKCSIQATALNQQLVCDQDHSLVRIQPNGDSHTWQHGQGPCHLMTLLLDLNVNLERDGMLVGLSFRTANRDSARRCGACSRPAHIHVFLAAFQVQGMVPGTYSCSCYRM